jgi:DNA helicase-2/ATP-dependent DNA helicase PcrA
MKRDEFFDKYINKLDREQKAAVANDARHLLLLAVPGSGKTTTLTARIAFMIACKNIDSDKMRVITFSKKAAEDMKTRFVRTYPGFKKPVFSTIHSFCLEVITKHHNKMGKKLPELIKSSRIKRILRNIIGGYNRDPEIDEIEQQITNCKNRNLKAEDRKGIHVSGIESFSEVFDRYEEILKNTNQYDYDDMLLMALDMLNDKTQREYWAKRYPYVFVDEAQDTSPIQQNIIYRLTNNDGSSLFMVGDEDQSIYGFRGADPSLLLKFTDVYKSPKPLLLETNYRCTKEIIQDANTLIKRNANRTKKEMKAGPEATKGDSVKYKIFGGAYEQYDFILEAYKKLPGHENLGILYRNNSSSVPIVFILNKNKIPFNLSGDKGLRSYFTLNHIKAVISILRFCCNTDNMDLFQEIYSKLGLYLSKNHLAQIKKRHRGGSIPELICEMRFGLTKTNQQNILRKMSQLGNIPSLSPSDALSSVLNEIGYKEWMKENYTDDYDRFLQDIEMLYIVTGNSHYLPEFFQTIDELKNLNIEYDPERKINLSTIHSSKGLEYDEVVITDLVSPTFPNERSDHEEETRLCYVAMTRAKKRLALLSYKKIGGNVVEPSEFITLFSKSNSKDKISPATGGRRGQGAHTHQMPAIHPSQLSVGISIVHKKFGKGMILENNDDIILVGFAKGKKSLQVNTCLENGYITIE